MACAKLDSLEAGRDESEDVASLLAAVGGRGLHGHGLPLRDPCGAVAAILTGQGRRRIAATSALLIAGFLAIALAATAGQQRQKAGLVAEVQFAAATPDAAAALGEAPSEDRDYVGAAQAFSAKVHKDIDQLSMQQQLEYTNFQSQVSAAQTEMRLEQGPHAEQLAIVVQRSKGANTSKPANTTMMLYRGSFKRDLGRVRDLYTFGAPGTSTAPLYDALSPDGCIAGLRVFSKGSRFADGTGSFFQITDPVAWITNGVKLQHARMASMKVSQDNMIRNPITPCGDGTMQPDPDGFFWVKGHLIYPKLMGWHVDGFWDAQLPNNHVANDDVHMHRHLQSASQPSTSVDEVAQAKVFAHFAFMNYQRTPFVVADAGSWGWRVVGRACGAGQRNLASGGTLGLTLKAGSSIDMAVGTLVDSCQDHTLLYQHEKTLDCALVFEGSDDFLDWLANINFAQSPFCGFPQVHTGFKNKLLRMIGGMDYAQVIRPKLKQCANVTVVGHSLGGAQAELFTACANRWLEKGSAGYAEYRLAKFSKAKRPKRLPGFYEDQAKGVFFRNKGNGLCIDIKGTSATDYETPVISFHCETPDSIWQKDQLWEFTPESLIKNKLSGKCIEANTTLNGGIQVKQWPCNPASTSQQWQLTTMGFLLNKGNQLCLNGDMTLYTCPFTDQLWELQGSQLVNKLSGLCLDVAESPGSALVLGKCASQEGGGQRTEGWELTEAGALRHSPSGLCANMRPQKGKEEKPTVELGKCNLEEHYKTFRWQKMSDGFLRDTHTGACLDVVGNPGKEPGTAIGIMPCQKRSIETYGLWKKMENGFIMNIGSNPDDQYKCVQVAGEFWDVDQKMGDGTPLALSACHFNTDQKWEVTGDGYIKSVIGGRKCLDIRPGLTGTLWLMNCVDKRDPSTYVNIKWTVTSLGQLQSRLNMQCATLAQDGPVGLADCADGDAATTAMTAKQLWEQREDGALTSGGKCLDVGEPVLAGTPPPLVMKECLGAAAGTTQEWKRHFNGFLLNKYHYYCVGVDVKPGHLDQQVLVLTPCPTSTQLWRVTANGQIQNRHTGKCIDVLRNTTGASWWDLVVWDCDNTRTYQQWEQVSQDVV